MPARSIRGPLWRHDAIPPVQPCSFGGLPAQQRVTLRPMTASDPSDFLCRNDILIMVTPGEYHEGGEGTDRACGNHPQMGQVSAKTQILAKKAETKPGRQL